MWDCVYYSSSPWNNLKYDYSRHDLLLQHITPVKLLLKIDRSFLCNLFFPKNEKMEKHFTRHNVYLSTFSAGKVRPFFFSISAKTELLFTFAFIYLNEETADFSVARCGDISPKWRYLTSWWRWKFWGGDWRFYGDFQKFEKSFLFKEFSWVFIQVWNFFPIYSLFILIFFNVNVAILGLYWAKSGDF